MAGNQVDDFLMARSRAMPLKLRECEGCNACCGQALRINSPELQVEKGNRCSHLCEKGCSLWGQPQMPQLCREYLCSYLAEPIPLSIEERPDHIGAIVQRRNHNKSTLLAELFPGGLIRLLRNSRWGPFLLEQDILPGEILEISFANDPHSAEMLRVRWHENRLGCELPSCDETGKPILIPIPEIHQQPFYNAQFYARQGFIFDAKVLIRYLGDKPRVILQSSASYQNGPQLRFLLTFRQVVFLNTLFKMIHHRLQAASSEI